MHRKTYYVTVEITIDAEQATTDAAVQESNMKTLAEYWVVDALDAYAHRYPDQRQRGSCRVARWDEEVIVEEKR